MEELRYQITAETMQNLVNGFNINSTETPNLTDFDINSTDTSALTNETLKNITEYKDIPSIRSQDSYILIYTAFIIGSIILTSARSLLYYKICMTASINLHNKMFANVLEAPKRFFDTNPSGKFAEL